MEAAVHHVLHHFSEFEALKPFVPMYCGYDPRQHVLVTEYIHNTANVWELTEQREQLSASQAKCMAHILASFHLDLTNRLVDDPTLSFLDQKLPWVLNLPNAVNHAPEVVFQHIKQDEFLLYKLDEAAHSWRCASIIHGDVKLQNFIAQQEANELKLVDWEQANMGDPLWDLAGLLQSYVAGGLAYMTSTAGHYELPVSKAYWEREKVLEMWRLIWQEYSSKMRWTSELAEEAALKTVGYMAARLLQSAAELNRVRPEFMAPGTWSMIAEARSYFRQPHVYSRQFCSQTSTVHGE